MGKRLRLLFVTTDLNIGSLVIRAIEEGSDVKVYSTVYRDNRLEGLLPASCWLESWEEHADWADVIIFDDVGWGKDADRLRKKGKRVVGGSRYTDRLEIDRGFGQKELRNAGVRVLGGIEFSDIMKAIKFIRRRPARYVLKLCGSHKQDSTIVAESHDSRDLLELIEHKKSLWEGKRFFLQRYVNGVEVAVGAPFDGNDFVYPLDVNFEHKRLFNGELGPLVWEMGTVLFHADRSRIFNETLLKMKPMLQKAGYVGDIDINCIINRRGIHPLEFTCRFGFPTTQLIWEDDRRSVSDYLLRLAEGRVESRPAPKGYKAGSLVCVPPFPFNDEEMSEKYMGALVSFDDKRLQGIHLVDCVRRGGRHLAIGPCPLIVCARSSTVKGACEKMYRRIRKIHIENKYYRTDIGARWERDSGLLREWGYL